MWQPRNIPGPMVSILSSPSSILGVVLLACFFIVGGSKGGARPSSGIFAVLPGLFVFPKIKRKSIKDTERTNQTARKHVD